MLMTGYRDPRLLQNVKAITNLVGIVHSAKTDLVGTPYHPEKFEQNIANGMCTWQLAMALEYAPWEDRKILLENYGSSRAENIEEVKGVYEKMELHKMYAQWEEEKCYDISDLVAQLPAEDLQKYFSHVFIALFGRNF
ncbi:unnamed protein product [Allacma fusca]|uniref:Uncharacterized protein n=1 Tax=Allacma fusca TaxID=39272 RepID=A0A8J2L3S5_9HEXA|nr:unnamed protein product [Allacma fusca]